MTIQDLGSAGEFVASIAVFITLIFLVYQVRQATEQIKSVQSQAFARWNSDFVESLANDRAFMEFWIKGANEFMSLDATDRQRLVMFEWRAISMWNHYFHMRKKGFIDEHLWEEMIWIFETMGQRDSMKQSWATFKDAYGLDFREFMDQYLA